MSRHLGYAMGCSSEAYQSMGRLVAASAIIENTLRRTLFITLDIDDLMYREFIGDAQLAKQCSHMNLAVRCAHWPASMRSAWNTLSDCAQYVGRVRNKVAHEVAYPSDSGEIAFSLYTLKQDRSAYSCRISKLDALTPFALEVATLIGKIPTVNLDQPDEFANAVKMLQASRKTRGLPDDP